MIRVFVLTLLLSENILQTKVVKNTFPGEQMVQYTEEEELGPGYPGSVRGRGLCLHPLLRGEQVGDWRPGAPVLRALSLQNFTKQSQV